METVVVRRLDGGPRLVIEDPYEIALDFFSKDASSVGSDAYDAWVERTDAVRIVTDDIYAINRTMRARSPHTAWAAFVGTTEPLTWLAALDPAWDLFELTLDEWAELGAGAKVAAALAALTGPYRNLSVVTKVLHAKRPRLFPVLDALVAEQVGWRAGAGPMTLLDHLRTEGRANLDVLQRTRERLASAGYRRTLVRVLDAILWTSHPAAGLGPELGRWERRVQLREGSSGITASGGTSSGGRALEECPDTRVDQQPDGLELDPFADQPLGSNPFDEAEPGGASGVTTGELAPWAYTGRLLGALGVAAQLHATQLRKGTTVPYLSHLIGACSIAMEFGANEDEAIAALLHDTIEDVQPVEAARAAVAAFGENVLRIVEACTDADTHPKPPWRERKQAYVAHLALVDRSVLLVSASDKLHNARAIVADVRRHGAAVWDRFSAPMDETLWYYRSLVSAFAANPGHEPALVAELDRTVTDMEQLARQGSNRSVLADPPAAPVRTRASGPDAIRELLERRTTSSRPLADALITAVAALPGVSLQLQKSKYAPAYFQVRHQAHRQVVAYVEPRQNDLSILYRLPADHDTGGLATTRSGAPRVKVTTAEEVAVAIRLVREAIAQTE